MSRIPVPKEEGNKFLNAFKSILGFAGAAAAPFTGGLSMLPSTALDIADKGISVGKESTTVNPVESGAAEDLKAPMGGLSLGSPKMGSGLLTQPEMKAPSKAGMPYESPVSNTDVQMDTNKTAGIAQGGGTSFKDVAQGAQMGLGLAQGGLSIANAFKSEEAPPQPLQSNLEIGTSGNPAQDLLRLQDSMRAAMTLPRAQREQVLPTFQQAMDELKGRLG